MSYSGEKVKHVPAPPPGKLGKAELYSLSIGQVIGAGIITLIGPAVAETGQSTWLAYLVAIILGFLLIMPILFLTSTLRLGGGYYSIIAGIPKLQNPVFDLSAPGFFSQGTSGFIAAVYLFSYSTYGYALTMSYGKDAKNAKRDIPWAIIASIPTLILLYCGVAIVGTGVLPLEAVANKPLTDVAQVILSKPLFVFFMIGGPIMALMTTMNSSMAYYAIPIQQSCEDGWFPKSFAAKNRFGVSWKIMTVIYLVGLIPLVLGFDINTITKNIMLLNSVLSFLYSYAYYQLPKKYPQAWAKSKLHMPNGAYYVMVTISLLAYVTVFFDSMRSLTPVVAIVSIAVIVCCMIFGFVRSKHPDVQVETSMWEE